MQTKGDAVIFTRLLRKYILNEDLEISHRLINMVLMVGPP